MELPRGEPDLSFLRQVPVLGGLGDAELSRLWLDIEVHRHGPGSRLVTEGELGNEMFVLLQGEVAVKSGGATLRTLNTGDCFGEMSLIDIQPRSASVEALTEVRVMVVGLDDLSRIFRADLETYTLIALNIARELSRRLRQANARLAALGEPRFGVP